MSGRKRVRDSSVGLINMGFGLWKCNELCGWCLLWGMKNIVLFIVGFGGVLIGSDWGGFVE